MKRSWKIGFGLLIVIAGVMLFSLSQKINQEKQKHKLETSIAKLLVSEYEGVEEVEFINWTHSLETGTWRTNVVVNQTNEMTFSFNGLEGLEEIGSSYYHPDTFKLKEKSGVQDRPAVKYIVKETEATPIDGVKVIYSSDKED